MGQVRNSLPRGQASPLLQNTQRLPSPARRPFPRPAGPSLPLPCYIFPFSVSPLLTWGGHCPFLKELPCKAQLRGAIKTPGLVYWPPKWASPTSHQPLRTSLGQKGSPAPLGKGPRAWLEGSEEEWVSPRGGGVLPGLHGPRAGKGGCPGGTASHSGELPAARQAERPEFAGAWEEAPPSSCSAVGSKTGGGVALTCQLLYSNC